MQPLVSVVVTTYNHEKFIAQALDSILSQVTSFDFEVMLGEDDSSDSTRILAKQYAADHPERISLVLQDRKNVIRAEGLDTGRFNFMDLMRRSKGKYIALCEGDDYWTDSLKLQKQVDLMESAPDISLCFHDVDVIFGEEAIACSPGFGHERRFATEDLFCQHFIPTCSMLFRNEVELPEWFTDVLSGDIPLHFLLSELGEFHYLPQSMAAYRKHQGGISNLHGGYRKAIGMARIYHYVDMHFEGKYRELVNKAIEYEIDYHVVRPSLEAQLAQLRIFRAFRIAERLRKLKSKITQRFQRQTAANSEASP